MVITLLATGLRGDSWPLPLLECCRSTFLLLLLFFLLSLLGRRPLRGATYEIVVPVPAVSAHLGLLLDLFRCLYHPTSYEVLI